MRVIAIALLGVLSAAPAGAVDRVVDANLVRCAPDGLPRHETIGDAVNAASPGDTIVVCGGRYVESVVLTTPGLTLRGEGDVLVSAPRGETSVFQVRAPGVTLRNLDVSGSRRSPDACAIRVISAESADLRDLRVHDGVHAICVGGGGGHRIRDNVIERTAGIAIAINQAGAEVSRNRTSHGGAFGLVVAQCAGLAVNVHHNVFTERTAMSIFACDALVSDNTIRGDDTEFGILATNGRGTVIIRNAIRNTNVGVKVIDAAGGLVSANTIRSSTVGIDVSSSTGVTVTGNDVSQSAIVDCHWDASGSNMLTDNRCGTESPAGTFR